MNKQKPGPKLPVFTGEVRARTFNVDEATVRKLDAMNPGNRSAALREAVRAHYAVWARTA